MRRRRQKRRRSGHRNDGASLSFLDYSQAAEEAAGKIVGRPSRLTNCCFRQ